MHKRPPRGAAVIVNRPDWPAPVRRDVLRPASDSARALQVKAVLAFGICAALVGLGAVYLALGVAADAGGESILAYLAHHLIYFIPLLIPLTAYFVIANWVGWQYFRNA